MQYKAIPRPVGAVFDFTSLWYDEVNECLYSFGGEQSYLDIQPKDLAVWRLQLDGKGGGTWTQNTTSHDPPFAQGLTRPFGGASTFTSNTGFYLGGYSSDHSSPATQDLQNFISTPGIVSYNFEDHTWANTTTGLTSLSPTGSFQWGGLEPIPFGPNGLLAIFGGETSNSDGVYYPGAHERPMDTVTLLDPITKIWYQQNLTGDIPSVRNRFCSVAATDHTPLKGTNGTHTAEVFMYGGYAGVGGGSTTVYDEIWALSIPAFTWHRIDASHKSTRIGHTCHLVGGRQMISIGGVDMAHDDPWSVPDYTNLNGIGVFDLVNETWTAGYDANAAPYRRSPTVEKYYDDKYAIHSIRLPTSFSK